MGNTIKPASYSRLTILFQKGTAKALGKDKKRVRMRAPPTQMFIGEFQHSVDEKGRMAIPAKFRTKVAGGAIITRGLDHCLFIFTPREWEELAKKLVSLPLAQANSRAFSRLMLAGASDVEIDKQGRILIPEYLREYAGIKKEVVVAGVFNRMEVWDSESWKSYKSRTESQSDEIAEKLSELGI